MGKKGKAAKATQKDQAKAEKKKKQEQKMKDATFGLKNKGKSKVVQQKIAHMQNSMNAPGSQRAALQQKAKKAQKEAEEKARLEMEAMFKTVKKKDNDNQKHLREEKKEEKKVVKVDPKVRPELKTTQPPRLVSSRLHNLGNPFSEPGALSDACARPPPRLRPPLGSHPAAVGRHPARDAGSHAGGQDRGGQDSCGEEDQDDGGRLQVLAGEKNEEGDGRREEGEGREVEEKQVGRVRVRVRVDRAGRGSKREREKAERTD